MRAWAGATCCAIGLHPLAMIFALMAFGELFGFAGVLPALPASAVRMAGFRPRSHPLPAQQLL